MPKQHTSVSVQVVPLSEGRQISWGSSRLQSLADRADDIRSSILEGGRAISDALPEIPSAAGWRAKEVSGSFGITLTAEAGVILSKASAEATFEVTVTFERESEPAKST